MIPIDSKMIALVICLCIFILPGLAEAQSEYGYEKTGTFFPDIAPLQKEDLEWGYLTVPENWDLRTGNKIRIAVAVLKKSAKKKKRGALVFIQGGPGASGIQNFYSWLRHDAREENDIILFDIRGTGFSEPRLCPDLGKEFFEILAKNQSEEKDEREKVSAAISCKEELIVRGIDIGAYNSLAIAKDLNFLKKELGYTSWNVYGVSYGTFVAQVYTSTFPNDLTSLVLDSPIDDISEYYSYNTKNYVNSLNGVFKKCESDPDCSTQYPNLEEKYYQTIKDLSNNPLTVKVEKHLSPSGTFTYNAEDFKIAIQQALYNKQLIEVMPLLIYQFSERNEDALGNLVKAFSNLLSLDYGLYYCVSCNEVLPNNSITDFGLVASSYDGLAGGISFYKSDFSVCNKWNLNRQETKLFDHDLSGLTRFSGPVAVIAGEFDPITPTSNGERVAKRFANGKFYYGNTYGHTPGFTKIGRKVTEFTINNGGSMLSEDVFKDAKSLTFAKNIKLNNGVSNMGDSLNQFDIFFAVPILIAFFLMGGFTVVYLIQVVRRKYKVMPDWVVRLSIVLTSIIGIGLLIGFRSAFNDVAGYNYFILAFGLPDIYNYLFYGVYLFAFLAIVTLIIFFLLIRKVSDRSMVFSVIFSNVLIVIYFLYWGVF